MKKRVVSLILATIFAAAALSGCAAVQSENLTDGINKNPVPVYNYADGNEAQAVAQFSVQLLKQLCTEDKNVVYSPLSVLYALAMTANGAQGETLSQMEAVMGMDVQSLNGYLYSTVNTLPSDEGYDFDIANSIWFKDDDGKFVVNEAFLQTVKDYYLAQIYKAPFDDKTLKDINNWVAQQTNGQIQNILDKIDPDAVMYLINALNFEALWLNDYDEYFTQPDLPGNGGKNGLCTVVAAVEQSQGAVGSLLVGRGHSYQLRRGFLVKREKKGESSRSRRLPRSFRS